MFSASVRFNLDPFNEHPDAEVWSVLEDVNMRGHVESLPGRLEEMVAESGDNFSAGQRQVRRDPPASVCFLMTMTRR